MTPERLTSLLERVASGQLSASDAVSELRSLPFSDIGSARIDHHRELRVGVPEVVLGQAKSVAQIVAAATELKRGSGRCLITRLTPEKAAEVREALPDLRYDDVAQVAWLGGTGAAMAGKVVVATGGTSDQAVASETCRTLDFLGVDSEVVADVGVAGLQRLLAVRPVLDQASVVIAIAGMEGALATAIAGLVAAPVIAVPTSVGYGASFGGLATLLAMLNSCAPGVAVVNIDNGFGAAVMARQILATATRI